MKLLIKIIFYAILAGFYPTFETGFLRAESSEEQTTKKKKKRKKKKSNSKSSSK